MKNILFISFLALLFTGCSKDPKVTDIPTDPGIPPQTQTGANIMVCKVNGKTHVYSSLSELFSENGVKVNKYRSSTDDYVTIWGEDTKYDDKIEINVFEKEWKIIPYQPYKLSGERKDNGQYFTKEQTHIFRSEINSGQVVYTRYDDKVVAGTFSFTAADKDSQKVVITDGYFDITVTP